MRLVTITCVVQVAPLPDVNRARIPRASGLLGRSPGALACRAEHALCHVFGRSTAERRRTVLGAFWQSLYCGALEWNVPELMNVSRPAIAEAHAADRLQGAIMGTPPAPSQEHSNPENAVASSPASADQRAAPSTQKPLRDIAQRFRRTVFSFTVGAALLAFWLVHHLIRVLAEPAHTFAILTACAGFLVVGGLVFLVFVIPAAASCQYAGAVKTEFHSARAAYLCVAAGLLLFIVTAIGATATQLLKAWR